MEGHGLAPRGEPRVLGRGSPCANRPGLAVLCVGDAGATRRAVGAAGAEAPLVAAARAAMGARGRGGAPGRGRVEGPRIVPTLGLCPVYGHALALV